MLIDRTNGNIASYKSLILHFDGGCEPKNPGGTSTSGWVLYSSEDPKTPIAEQGVVVREGDALATNNYGEYCALEIALTWLMMQKWRGELLVKADSKLVVEQVNKRWKVKAAHILKLRDRVLNLVETLEMSVVSTDNPVPPEGESPFTLLWIPRELNGYANDLCRAAYKRHVATKKAAT